MLMRQRNKLSSHLSRGGRRGFNSQLMRAGAFTREFVSSQPSAHAPWAAQLEAALRHTTRQPRRERGTTTQKYLSRHGNGTHQGLNPNPNPNHLTFTLECRERHWIRRFGPHTTRVSPAQVTLLNTIPDWCAHDCARARPWERPWREPLWSICLARLRRSVHMHRPDALGRHTHE